eukprot:COSAG06_NODE_7992_length_2308_cov_4.414667_3_plen_37_part_00
MAAVRSPEVEQLLPQLSPVGGKTVPFAGGRGRCILA